MSDVSAVLFTLDEPYTARAIESLRRQSLPAADLIVVGPDEAPFHRAFNAGASQVRTEYFLQLDADLVLDADCIAVLRACMADELGVVTGRLRDPLLGRIGAVRLFRTACFERTAFPDTVSPDTDFVASIYAAGWRRLDALARRAGPAELWHTVGEHRPDYTPLYTFAKFRLDGARYRYRRDPYTLRDVAARLRRSTHPAAVLALIALLHGVFHRDTSDQLRRYDPDEAFECVNGLLAAAAPDGSLPSLAGDDMPALFARFFRHGAQNGASVPFALRQLGADAAQRDLIAALGLCHGMVQPAADPDTEFDLLRGWLL